MAYQTQHCINSLTYHQRINYSLTYDYIFKKNLLKKEFIFFMWLRFSVLLLMAVLMFIFICHEINQSYLDFWFILYFLFYMAIVLFWKPSKNKK